MNELRDPYLLLPEQAESLHPHIDWQQVRTDWQAFAENFNTNFVQPLTQTLAKMFQDFTEALRPTFKAVAEALETISEALWKAYLADGAIYGETQEGMLRWMKEKGEIARLQMQAERIEQQQESVRSFKRMLAEKRGEQP